MCNISEIVQDTEMVTTLITADHYLELASVVSAHAIPATDM